MNDLNEERSQFDLDRDADGEGSPNMWTSLELALNSYRTFTLADEHIKNLSVDELEKGLQQVRLSTEAMVKTSRSPSGAMHFLLHGDTEAIRKAEKAIHFNLAKSSEASKITISFEIPSRARSLVVGKRGSVVRSIKRQHNVIITIDRRRLRRCKNLSDYYKSDQLRLIEEDPYVAARVQFLPSVKVTIEGTVLGCTAAKALILKIAGDSVEEVFRVPCKLFFEKAERLVKESFEAVSVTNSVLGDLDLMIVQGPRADVNAAVERFHSIEECFHVTMAIPTALKHRIIDDYTAITDIIPQESLNDDMEEWHEIWGEESLVLRVQQLIIQFISSLSRVRLTLADLHNGDVAHVRAVLSLEEVKSAFEEFKYGRGHVLAAYPDNTTETHFIDFYSQDREDVAKAVTKLKTLIQSVSPNDLFVIHDKDLVGELHMFTSGNTLKDLPDKTLKCRVMKDSFVVYRGLEGKNLHSQPGARDDAIMSGVEHIRQMVKLITIVVLDVPSMSQPILRMPHLNDITPGAQIWLYRNGLEDDKDKVTLCGDHEAVSKARDVIREVLDCEKNYPTYTQVIEIPSFFAYVLKRQMMNRDEQYKLPFGISLHISRKDGFLRKKGKHTTVEDKSLVILSGNKFYVEASKKIIKEELHKFLELMFTLSTEIDEAFLMRVTGRDFRHIKQLERVHRVRIALPEERPSYPFLFRTSEFENTLDQVNISGASKELVLDAKDELMRILDSKKKSTETTTLRIPNKFGNFLREPGKCKRPGVCLGVDFIFHDRDVGFVDVEILGCSPDFEGAVNWIKYLVGQDIIDDNESD